MCKKSLFFLTKVAKTAEKPYPTAFAGYGVIEGWLDKLEIVDGIIGKIRPLSFCQQIGGASVGMFADHSELFAAEGGTDAGECDTLHGSTPVASS